MQSMNIRRPSSLPHESSPAPLARLARHGAGSKLRRRWRRSGGHLSSGAGKCGAGHCPDQMCGNGHRSPQQRCAADPAGAKAPECGNYFRFSSQRRREETLEWYVRSDEIAHDCLLHSRLCYCWQRARDDVMRIRKQFHRNSGGGGLEGDGGLMSWIRRSQEHMRRLRSGERSWHLVATCRCLPCCGSLMTVVACVSAPREADPEVFEQKGDANVKKRSQV